ncbi:MAG: peptidylprolyl isomerase, partial [Candidatus Cloacimonadota bacterium]|nr:peptidylprolyl isomerase [Candidatus Cloacimonadota bacterium]
MKKIIFITLVLIVQTIFAKPIDKIVAKIGNEIVLQSELDQAFAQINQFGQQNISKLDVLDQIIESKLIIQKAEVDEYQVDINRIRQETEKYLEQVKAKYPSEEQFYNDLSKAGLTLSDLKIQYKNSLKEQQLKQRIIMNEINRKINITDAELQDYYKEKKDLMPIRPEKNKIGIIMRKVEAGKKTKKDNLSRINEIIEKLHDGKNFTKLAKKYSEGPSGKSGGNLGWVEKGMMVKSFEDAAFKLKVDEISDVVKTQFGYHVIKVTDKRYSEIKVKHILIKEQPSKVDIQAVNKLMQNIIVKYNSGIEFSQLAKTYSQDDSTAVNGGIMGEFSNDEYPQIFTDYLQNLDYGEVSEVIDIEGILYILAKLEKVESRPYKYSELYDELFEE